MAFRHAVPRVAIAAVATALILSLAVGAASADTVVLRSGDRITGKVAGFDGTTLEVETDYAGTVPVKGSAVASVTTDGVVTVSFADGSRASGVLRTTPSGLLSISGGRAGAREGFTFGSVAAIARGEATPRRFRWSGRISAGFSRTDGNSDTQAANVAGAVKGRSKTQRITADVAYNRETSDGSETVDDARLRAKHDNFINEKLYLYTNGGLERDDIADLIYRANVGTGLGLQVYESPAMNLSVEGGPSFVHESFSGAKNQDKGAVRWALDFDKSVFSGFLTAFHQHEVLVEVTGGSAALIRSSTGVRMPLAKILDLTAQVDADYDTEPAPGNEKLDLKYLLSVGYAW